MMNNMQLKRYMWRLHPPPLQATAAKKKCGGFNLNDNVYIRPKWSKELGISGRIVDVVCDSTSSLDTKHNDKVDDGSSSINERKSSKRRKVEEVRVSIQPHCFINHVHKSCRTIKENVRPSRLSPVYDIDIERSKQKRDALILLTPDTTNYRQLAASHLRYSDKVLEIGCSTGECTALLLRRLLLLHLNQHRCFRRPEEKVDNIMPGSIIAFDTGSEMIGQARKRLLAELDNHAMPVSSASDNDNEHQQQSNKNNLLSQLVQFYKVDALSNPKGAHSHVTHGSDREPDIILIDIGGNRELKGVVSMIDWVQSMFQSIRLIIVKSEALTEELQKHDESLKQSSKGDDSEENRNRIAASPSVLENGVILNAQEWFESLLSCTKRSEDAKFKNSPTDTTTIPSSKQKQSAPKYSHPMKAPLVFSPKDNTTPICRFHNYASDGCKRHKNNSKVNEGGSSRCQFDHEHCHWCLEPGHVAMNCPH